MDVVVKRPGAARTMNEVADLVGLALPEAAYPALVAMLLPLGRIEVAFLVEGTDVD